MTKTNHLTNFTPEQREEMRQKAHVARLEKMAEAEKYKQDYSDMPYWKELASKYGVRMPPYYAHCSETKYLKRAMKKIDANHSKEYPEAMGCKTLNELIQCNPTYTAQATIGLYLEWVESLATL